MPEALIVAIPLLALLALMVARVPVGIALAAAGALGIVLIGGAGRAETTLASLTYTAISTHSLVLIPMFILMGLFVSHAGLLEGIFDVVNRVIGRMPGGLAVSAILGAVAFGGISGSSSADAATIGRLSIREMSKRGYDEPYAAATVASAATVANLIPPSIVLVLYGIMTQESIGALLLAGIIPGLLCGAVFIALVILGALWKGGPGRGGRAQVRPVDQEAVTGRASVEPAREITARTVVFSVATLVVLFGTIVGGIYSGVFTATEAGAVAAAIALMIALIYTLTSKGRGRVTRARKAVVDAIGETGSLTAMIFLLVIGSMVFTQYLVLARIPNRVSDWILGLDVAPVVVVILLFAILVVLGMIIDGLSLLIIVTPLAYPVVVGLGFDGVWFGVIMVMAIEVGLLTPPVGLNVFVVSGLIPGLRAEAVYRRIVPFILCQFVVIALLIAFPDLVLLLPHAMK